MRLFDTWTWGYCGACKRDCITGKDGNLLPHMTGASPSSCKGSGKAPVVPPKEYTPAREAAARGWKERSPDGTARPESSDTKRTT